MEQLILKSNKRRNQLCLNVIITHIFKVQKSKNVNRGRGVRAYDIHQTGACIDTNASFSLLVTKKLQLQYLTG